MICGLLPPKHGATGPCCDTVRNAVGMIEIANFGKHRVEGPGARAWLDRILAGRLPDPGRVALSPMLSPKGRLAGGLTVSCLAGREQGEEHDHAPGPGARDIRGGLADV